jgi:hypothetical protein
MSSILDSMITKTQVFVPESVVEYIALQLARKLDDTDEVLKYLSLLDRYALSMIIEAFGNAQTRLRTGEVTGALAFEEELLSLTTKGRPDEF